MSLRDQNCFAPGARWALRCPRGRDAAGTAHGLRTWLPLCRFPGERQARHSTGLHPGQGKLLLSLSWGRPKHLPQICPNSSRRSPGCRAAYLLVIPALPAGLGRAGLGFEHKNNCPVLRAMENVPGAPAGGSKTGWQMKDPFRNIAWSLVVWPGRSGSVSERGEWVGLGAPLLAPRDSRVRGPCGLQAPCSSPPAGSPLGARLPVTLRGDGAALCRVLHGAA